MQAEIKALGAEVAELKAQVANAGRISLVDVRPAVSVAVAEELRAYEERRREGDEHHTERPLSLGEEIVDMRGSLLGRAPNIRRRM